MKISWRHRGDESEPVLSGQFVLKIAQHTVVGAWAAIPAYHWSITGAVGLFLASVVIDVDHFIFFLFRERNFSVSVRRFFSVYRRWSYYGPRIHILHNYELVVLLGALAWIYGGVLVYLFVGVLLHLMCDQADSYWMFRHMRVRTLLGDIIRYRGYVRASLRGDEKEYMIDRRDTWWSHLRNRLSKERFRKAENTCGILNIYPEIPINKSSNGGTWERLL
jgi:hypothetical protein